ncbi:MAG: M15 family metallopeptidase [Cyanobacteria bacterium J06560_2]
MKKFNRLPLWLKVMGPLAFASICLGINAIAFSEIRQSVQARRPTPAAPTPEPVTIQNTAVTVPTDNQLVATPTDSQPTDTRITLRPVSSDTFINDPQPIKITPVIHRDERPIGPFPAEPNTAEQNQLDPASAEAAPPNAVQSEAAESTPANAAPANTAQTTPAQTADARTTAAAKTTETKAASEDKTTASQDTAAQSQQLAKYGHFPYLEGNPADMSLVASYAEGTGHRAETLHPEAAAALLEMVAAARVDGIWLVPASGFRTIAQQRTLFNAQIERKGSPEAAARISAPPGYSEHHTGYAVDLADGALPQTQDIDDSFADTEAYQWLLANAQNHGFELSFPQDNPQGIAFEPWHWRYIGSVQSRESLGRQAPDLDTRNTTSTLLE